MMGPRDSRTAKQRRRFDGTARAVEIGYGSRCAPLGADLPNHRCAGRGDWARVGASESLAEDGSMRGVVFLGERRLEIRDFPDPAPGPGEVVIEIKASG